MALKAQVAKFAAEKRNTEASAFVDNLIRQSKLLPAQRQSAIARLSRDLQYDDEHPNERVSFAKADGSTVQMSSSELTKELFNQMPQHGLLMRTPISDLPDGAVVMGAGSTSQRTPYDDGLEIGKKWVESNSQYRNNGK